MRTFQEQLDSIDRRQVAGGAITMFGVMLLLRPDVGTLLDIQEVLYIPTRVLALAVLMGGFLLMLRQWHRVIMFIMWLPTLIYPAFLVYGAFTGDTITLAAPFAFGWFAFSTFYLLFILRRPRVGNT